MKPSSVTPSLSASARSVRRMVEMKGRRDAGSGIGLRRRWGAKACCAMAAAMPDPHAARRNEPTKTVCTCIMCRITCCLRLMEGGRAGYCLSGLAAEMTE
jgi:hypothetical protein